MTTIWLWRHHPLRLQNTSPVVLPCKDSYCFQTRKTSSVKISVPIPTTYIHSFTYLFIHSFIYLWLHWVFAAAWGSFIHSCIYLWLRWVFVAARGLSLFAASGGCSSLRSTGSRHTGFRCGSQAQQLWCTGLVAPQHVGSSWTRAQTHVPCIGRRILNHCAIRVVPYYSYLTLDLSLNKRPEF